MSVLSHLKQAVSLLIANPSLLPQILKDPLNPKSWQTPKGRAVASKRKGKKP